MSANANHDRSKDWGALMVRAQSGDAQAYETLLTELTEVLSAFVRKRIRDEQHVEDIVQNTLIGIHKARSTYDGSKDFKAWVFAITRYKITDFLRKWGRITKKEVFDEEVERFAQADEEDFFSETLSEPLQEALISLPKKQKEIVEFLKINGRSVKETASALGMSEGAVKVNAHRAYKKMRKKLEKTGVVR